MSFRPHRRWSEFSHRVQDLRHVLLAWFEDLVSGRVKQHKGSDSIGYPPNDWSKYKLLPFDNHKRSPICGGGEGVLACLDRDECERTFTGPSMLRYADLPWHDEPIEVRVVRARTYWAVRFAADQVGEEHAAVLRDLGNAIRVVERS